MPVELERAHLGCRVGERERQGPETRTDLEDTITEADVREAHDPPRGVRIDEEVLPEGPARVQVVRREQRSHVDRAQHGHGDAR